MGGADWWVGALIGWFVGGATIGGIGLILGGAIGGFIGAGTSGSALAQAHYTNTVMNGARR